MSDVVVVTDSCASLPDAFYDQYGIICVPYYVHIGNKSYRDLVDITRQEFVDHLRTATELPKSANPSSGDYLQAFRTAASRARHIVTICMTAQGSGGYQSASLAKEMAAVELPETDITIVDSRNVSMGYGWMVTESARAALAGATLEDILQLIERMIPVARMLQTADTLRYLYMGGRIGRAKHLVGSLLNIKPIIGMEDGVIVALGQDRSRQSVYRHMVQIITAHLGERAKIKAAIVHAGDEQAAEVLKGLISESFPCDELLTTELSCALTVHTGPGTVGVCYYPSSALQA